MEMIVSTFGVVLIDAMVGLVSVWLCFIVPVYANLLSNVCDSVNGFRVIWFLF